LIEALSGKRLIRWQGHGGAISDGRAATSRGQRMGGLR
jgi:hypothetical protein